MFSDYLLAQRSVFLLELALICRDQTKRVDFFVMLITAGACMALNTAAGFLIGWLMAALLIWGVFRIDPPSTLSDGT